MIQERSGRNGCHRLRSVSMVGGFLDGAGFELADGLNCIIGARGTGKTTVLEFVRYAMDAMPADGCQGALKTGQLGARQKRPL